MWLLVLFLITIGVVIYVLDVLYCVNIIQAQEVFFQLILKCCDRCCILDMSWDAIPNDGPRSFYHFFTELVIRSFHVKGVGMNGNADIKVVVSNDLSTRPSAMIVNLVIIREPSVKIARAFKCENRVNKFGYVELKNVFKF